MRLRARHVHHIEALTDNVIGYLLNIVTSAIVFNWIVGIDLPLKENAQAGVWFFLVAYARKYTVRRWFNGMIKKLYAQRCAVDGCKEEARSMGGECVKHAVFGRED